MGSSGASGTPSSPFRVRNYRHYFVGQSLSNVGTWFQLLAQSLLILKLSKSGASLGAVFAAQAVPQFLFGPFIAPFLDRADLRRVLVLANAAAGGEALLLGILTSEHLVNVPIVIGLSVVLGVATIFLRPALQALLSELVPVDLLAGAVTLNSVQVAAGRLAGPALAALVYAWRGAAVCFDLNAASYLVAVAAVGSLRGREMLARVEREREREKGELRTAFSMIWHTHELRDQLLANAVIGLLAFNFPLFYSSFSVIILHHGDTHAGAITFGLAESLNAAFATAGGLVLSHRMRRPRRSLYVVTCLALGFSLGLVAISPNTTVFLLAMPIFGLAIVSYMAVNQGALQTASPRDKVGSVMTLSFYGQQGTSAPGALIVGWLITVGTPRAAIGAGAASAIGAGVVLGVGLLRARGASRLAPSLE